MRFLFYSHDGLGLGHTRRHVAVAAALSELAPEASILLASGADDVNRLGLPAHIEVLKLPGLRKVANEEYSSRRLRIPTTEIRALRSALLLTAVSAVIYLIQERELKRKTPRRFYYRLPPLGTLDELISRFMAVGFVFITLATIAGSTWAFIEHGTSWISDPRISISFVTWGIYLAMVFLRVTAGWRGRKAAIMAITALGCSVITWAAHSGMRFNMTQ